VDEQLDGALRASARSAQQRAAADAFLAFFRRLRVRARADARAAWRPADAGRAPPDLYVEAQLWADGEPIGTSPLSHTHTLRSAHAHTRKNTRL
jgi:hypothetical protein